VEFLPTPAPQLYAADSGDLWIAYFLPKAPNPPPPSIPLDTAFAGSGTFVLSAAPGLDIKADANAVATAVAAALNNSAFPGTRAFAWLLNPAAPSIDNIALAGFTANGSTGYISPGLNAVLVSNNLFLTIGANVKLSLKGDAVTLSGAQGVLGFTGAALSGGSITTASATLSFSGSAAGAIVFDVSIQRAVLHGSFHWGFQLLYSAGEQIYSQWYPLADGLTAPSSADMLRFNVCVDPSDPTNSRLADRTYLSFTGQNDGGARTALVSGYTTAFGDTINLVPIGQPQQGEQVARLTLAIGNPTASNPPEFAFGPEGDFILSLEGAKDGQASLLLCGLAPTETLTFQSGPKANPATGDRLRFTSNCAAFAGTYPPAQANTLGPPIDLRASPLGTQYTTAWATLMNPPGSQPTIHYCAQPKGSPLFGFDKVISPDNKGLLGLVDPGYLLGGTPVFPLLPYRLATLDSSAGHFDETSVGGVEQFNAAPARRAILAAPGMMQPEGPTRLAAVSAAKTPGATPSGLLAMIDLANGKFDSVVLGVNYHAEPSRALWMLFNNPSPKLQQALQTSQLFLVAADPTNLGEQKKSPAGATPPPPTGTPTFYNVMAVDDWEITASVGSSNDYGDYNNILVIKGCKGKLVDLASKPDGWTQRQDFSIPNQDSNQITVLSQWLGNYIQDGIDQWEKARNPYFENFARIAEDPGWTGILVLKASLTQLPANLDGLLSVIDPSQCFAHHLGITISQITAADGDIKIPTSSSIFELIYYVKPGFDSSKAQPLPPASTRYDFQLLSLKALFENTTVKAFESFAQLTLGNFFGDPVAHMQTTGGNIFNTILLQGSYQRRGDLVTFLLDSVAEDLFYLDSNVINKVEIAKAQFNTIDRHTLRFDLWGYLDFRVLTAIAEDKTTFPFDAFGFGSQGSGDELRQGLNFSGLSIIEDTSSTPTEFTFDPAKMAFNPTQPVSTPRAGSLYQGFALQLQGLLRGDAGNDPSTQNYLTLPTNAPLYGVSGREWYALQFALQMGSVGALAGSSGLTASLIVAWAPGTRASSTEYDVAIGLQLPGVAAKTNLLSLQGVLALSIGVMRLSYEVPSDSSSRFWVLWLNDIALKFLGLLKIPPNGAMSFACFGNPNASAQPSALGWYAVYNQQPPKQALPGPPE
jgi:hypothetical protein